MAKNLFDKASKESLENAELWIKDAEILFDNSSFGHAYSLLVIADEETTKSLICWLVAENMIPYNSKMVKKTFWNHKTKGEMSYWIEVGAILRAIVEKMSSEKDENDLSKTSDDDDFKEVREWLNGFLKWMDVVVSLREKIRQGGLYVNLDWDKGIITTPKMIDNEIVQRFLEIVKRRYEGIKHIMAKSTNKEKKRMKEIFSYRTENLVTKDI